jgi:hypothetical protein
MTPFALVVALAAAAMHSGSFAMESVLFERPRVHQMFEHACDRELPWQSAIAALGLRYLLTAQRQRDAAVVAAFAK